MSLNIDLRGIRQAIPTGYLLGRLSIGTGRAELVSASQVIERMRPALYAIVGPRTIQTSGAGITNTDGTLSVEWNAGTVNALGTGLSISSGTLNATNPPVTVAAHSLFGNPGTATAAGTSVAIGTGLTLTLGGTLSSTVVDTNIWNAGTVTTVGANLSLAAGTLTARGPVLPMVTGALPGPELIADPSGQCVGGPI